MTYHLGKEELTSSTFTEFNSLIEGARWDECVDELSKTDWCSQIGDRCTRDKSQILQCKYRLEDSEDPADYLDALLAFLN